MPIKLFYLRHAHLLCCILLCCQISVAQVTPFENSLLDSLSANEFNGSLSYGANLGQDGTSTLTTSANAAVMYSTAKSNYQLIGSNYFNRLDAMSTSNWLTSIAIASLFSHNIQGKTIKENKFYPEPFFYYCYDANRGINYRMQLGFNGVYAFRPTKIIRMKMGVGVLYEKENWQIIQEQNLNQLDSISQEEKDYLLDTVGINSKGQLFRDNFRLNLYANFICTFGKNVNLNAFVNVQEPFIPPYHNLPPDPRFPIVTKRYPRITTNMHLAVTILKSFSLVTDFTLQYDKGQIPLYVPNFVYSLTQGLGFDF